MSPSPFVGKQVLIRSNMAGVHRGLCTWHEGGAVILSNARRYWSWTAKNGVALSGVAAHGLKSGNVDAEVPTHYIGDVVEIMECSGGGL